MVYNKKRGGAAGGVSKKGGPNDRGTFKNQTKIGEATAKRMHEKLGKLKKAAKEEDEIKSNDSDGYGERE